MKVLILGSRGFIGSNLERHMREHGFNVWGIDMKSDDLNVHLPIKISYADSIDITSAVYVFMPDIIIDCAATVGVKKVLENSRETLRNNTDIPLGVIKTIETFNKDRDKLEKPYHPNIVFLSSSEVYGNVDDVRNTVFDINPQNPRSSYAISKLFGEYIYFDAQRRGVIDHAVVMRLFNIVGKGQNKDFAIPKMCRDMILDQEVYVTDHYREFCHVDFLCEFITNMCDLNFDNIPQLFDFGTRNPKNNVSMRRVAELIKESYERLTGNQVPEDFIKDSRLPSIDHVTKKSQHYSSSVNNVFNLYLPNFDMKNNALDMSIDDIVNEVMIEQLEDIKEQNNGKDY